MVIEKAIKKLKKIHRKGSKARNEGHSQSLSGGERHDERHDSVPGRFGDRARGVPPPGGVPAWGYGGMSPGDVMHSSEGADSPYLGAEAS